MDSQPIKIDNPLNKKSEILNIFKNYNITVEILKDNEKVFEIEVKNPTGEINMYLTVDEEFTLAYSGYHAHYYAVDEEDFKYLTSDIERILKNEICITILKHKGKWKGSTTFESGIPENARIKELKEVYLRFIEDFKKTIKKIQEEYPKKQISTMTIKEFCEDNEIEKNNEMELIIHYWDNNLNKHYNF